MSKRRLTDAEIRKRNLDRAGMTIIAACVLAFAGLFYGAYKVDQARGISVGQSLQSVGL